MIIFHTNCWILQRLAFFAKISKVMCVKIGLLKFTCVTCIWNDLAKSKFKQRWQDSGTTFCQVMTGIYLYDVNAPPTTTTPLSPTTHHLLFEK